MKRQLMREFPGNPVVRTLCFHCRVPGLRSLVREDSPCGQKKKKDNPQNEKIFAKHQYDKGLVFRKYEELLQLNNKKTNTN